MAKYIVGCIGENAIASSNHSTKWDYLSKCYMRLFLPPLVLHRWNKRTTLLSSESHGSRCVSSNSKHSKGLQDPYRRQEPQIAFCLLSAIYLLCYLCFVAVWCVFLDKILHELSGEFNCCLTCTSVAIRAYRCINHWWGLWLFHYS